MILDTSVLVAAERGHFNLEALLDDLGEAQVGIASITVSELLHGVHRAPDADIRARRAARVTAVLERLPVYVFGIAEAHRHAEIGVELRLRGTMIGPHDLLIAATAIARGEMLCTLNEAEFARVPGLRLMELGR